MQINGKERRVVVFELSEYEQTSHEEQYPIVRVWLGECGVSEALCLLGVVHNVSIHHDLGC